MLGFAVGIAFVETFAVSLTMACCIVCSRADNAAVRVMNDNVTKE